MSLYKLVTIENVDLNYKAFKKDELIDCILNLRTTYFRLKKENEENKQLKDNWNELKKWLRIKDILANSKINTQSIKFKDLLKHMEYLEKEK